MHELTQPARVSTAVSPYQPSYLLLRLLPPVPHLPGPWQHPVYAYPDPLPQFATGETRQFEGESRKTLAKNKEIVGDDVDAAVQLCAEVGDRVLIVFNFVHLATRALVDRSPCYQDMIALSNFSSVDWLVKSTDPTWGIEIENGSKVGFAILSIKKRFG
ncbi:hypothetical protein OPV22_032808 [Ensete ventricosum]|uniref:Uncharacterized protein n=1 Tax=Ensete ventricosum TaxID=4639 RepID=A0AAV8PXM7_ENSVE|nr:hypothetical protein OPV22_032808 [Ensete ventricosum]RWW11388.1 hypothetical protein GW17_00025003 [Ensete ventricosum]